MQILLALLSYRSAKRSWNVEIHVCFMTNRIFPIRYSRYIIVIAQRVHSYAISTMYKLRIRLCIFYATIARCYCSENVLLLYIYNNSFRHRRSDIVNIRKTDNHFRFLLNFSFRVAYAITTRTFVWTIFAKKCRYRGTK